MRERIEQANGFDLVTKKIEPQRRIVTGRVKIDDTTTYGKFARLAYRSLCGHSCRGRQGPVVVRGQGCSCAPARTAATRCLRGGCQFGDWPPSGAVSARQPVSRPSSTARRACSAATPSVPTSPTRPTPGHWRYRSSLAPAGDRAHSDKVPLSSRATWPNPALTCDILGLHPAGQRSLSRRTAVL